MKMLNSWRFVVTVSLCGQNMPPMNQHAGDAIHQGMAEAIRDYLSGNHEYRDASLRVESKAQNKRHKQ